MLKIIYENERFLVVDKPSGWLTIPGRTGDSDPRPVLSKTLAETGATFFIVHRLDADVRGLVLFAKDATAHRAANRWFEERLVRKTYQAFTEASATSVVQEQAVFVWDDKLVRGKKRTFAAPHGKSARTEARCKKIYNASDAPVLEWELYPVTGRTHQLRVHLAMHDFPILGDALYGSAHRLKQTGICLLSLILDFSRCGDAPSFNLPTSIHTTPLVLSDFI